VRGSGSASQGKAAPRLAIATRIIYARRAMAKIIHFEERLPKVDLHVQVDNRVYTWLRHLERFTGDTPEVMVAKMLSDIKRDDDEAGGLTHRH
jgi:hypothetical protein